MFVIELFGYHVIFEILQFFRMEMCLLVQWGRQSVFHKIHHAHLTDLVIGGAVSYIDPQNKKKNNGEWTA